MKKKKILFRINFVGMAPLQTGGLDLLVMQAQGFLTSPAGMFPGCQVMGLQDSRKASPPAAFWVFLALFITLSNSARPRDSVRNQKSTQSTTRNKREEQHGNITQVHLQKQTKLPFLFLRSPAVFQTDSWFRVCVRERVWIIWEGDSHTVYHWAANSYALKHPWRDCSSLTV